jgi:hypothetical protein
VLENSGRDEVVVDSSTGLEPLTEGQELWDDLKTFLGEESKITQAFAVTANAAAPQLVYKTQVRQRAQQQQASIGKADHLLVVDEFGAYRGQVEFKVANETEQFLEVQLPEDARLWVALVNGEPVKPVEPTTATPGLIRIPLIKTAQGEGDYPVILKHGGKIPQVRELSQVNFPLIKVVNLNIEQSHVRLYLPKTFHWNWLEFGGTMRLVPPKVIIEESANYFNKQIIESNQLRQSGDDFTKVRASNNLKKIELDLYRYKAANPSESTVVDAENVRLLKEANEEIVQQQQELQMDGTDNRGRLNYLWSAQKQERTKNNAAALGSNFDMPNQPPPQPPVSGKPQAFNQAWLDQNALSQKKGGAVDIAGKEKSSDGKNGDKGDETMGSRVAVGRKGKMSGQNLNPGQAGQPGQGQGERPGESAQQLELNDYARRPGNDPKSQQEGGAQNAQPQAALENDNRDGQKDQLRRYGERLDAQTKQQQRQVEPQSNAMGLAQSGIRANQPGMPGIAGPQVSSGAMPGGGPEPGSQAPGAGGVGGMGGGSGTPAQPRTPGTMGPPIASATTATEQGFVQNQSDSAASAEATGFASLDVEIPKDASKYNEFLFTTTSKDLAITARPVSSFLTTRLIGIAWLAVIIALAWILTRRGVHAALVVIARSPLTGAAMIVLGIAALISGILPMAGLLLGLVGICQLTFWLVTRAAPQRTTA